MRVRRLSPKDRRLPEVAEWIFDQWGHLNQGATLAETIERLQIRAAGDLIPSVYIAESYRNVIGTASIIQCDLPTRPAWTPWVASVFVVPKWRRRGVATAILEYIELQARAGGIDTLSLFTPDQQRFYAKLNYLIREELSYRGQWVTVMSKRLSPTTGRRPRR